MATLKTHKHIVGEICARKDLSLSIPGKIVEEQIKNSMKAWVSIQYFKLDILIQIWHYEIQITKPVHRFRTS